MLLKRKTLALWAIWGLALPLRTEAQKLQGAASALQQLDAQKPLLTKASGGRNPVASLRRDLVAFREKAPSLPPQEAARQWLALANRYPVIRKPHSLDDLLGDMQDEKRVRIPFTGGGFTEEEAPVREALSFQEALEALPPPSAWNALAAEIQAHPPEAAKRTSFDLGLLLLSHVLQNASADQWRDMQALKAQIAGADTSYREDLYKTFVWLTKQLMKQSTDPQQIQQGVELQLAFPEADSRWDGTRIPDLVTLLGSQKAEALLRQALLKTQSQIEIPAGEATRGLARKLALELADQVKVAPWELAYSLDTTELYEALAKRFPVQSGMSSDPEEKKARLFYMVGLVVKGRTEQAAKIAASVDRDMKFDGLDTDLSTDLDRSGHTGKFVTFLQAQLTQNPALPLWEIYIPTAARIGQTEPMLKLARAAEVRKDLAPEQRAALRMSLYHVLLATDRVEEGVAVIKRILADPPAPYRQGMSDRYDTALQLIRIGYYLKRDDWITTGVTFVKNAMRTGSENTSPYFQCEFGILLREMGRYSEAEKTLIAALAQEVKSNSHSRSAGAPELYEGEQELVSLAQFYYHAGRYPDVMTLIDRAPNWRAKDVADLNPLADGSYGEPPMPYVAAVALAETGRRPEAIALLQRLLLTKGGFDPAYERLLALQGQQAIPFLDTLFQRNRFEERPLIWKAVLLQRAGHLAEAEKTVRAAIAIDPSDGDEGHGDRMRAYSVLADIRDARGNHAEAKQCREVVQAIRISERADDLVKIGLNTRAVALYQQALRHFTDAYCIQSRLAVQMMRHGHPKEAAEHYRRAYELMPSSFGRMESHCFGCEGVFQGNAAQNTAERVFLEMLKKTPAKPQLHYLLGYLCEQEGRYAEALVYYREAVALDPDYVNAWQQMHLVGERIALPEALRNTIDLNRMRLQGDVRRLLEVTDLPAVWAAVQTARAANPAQQLGAIYPFSVSKAALEMLEATKKEKSGFAQSYTVRYQGTDANFWVALGEQSSTVIPPPNQVIAHQEVVSLIVRLLDDQLFMMENQPVTATHN